jgi:hypothetical protein
MSDTAYATFGGTATLSYGDDQAMAGTVVEIKRNADKTVRLVGIIPDGTDHVAWFRPSPRYYGLKSVGGSVLAYL